MEPEEESGSTSQNQNLHDLQNYLVTFKNEIESSDDVLTNIDVDGGDVSDLYSGSSNHLQDPGDAEVSGQFSSGFYSQQGMLGTTLSDEPTQQHIQSLVSSTEPEVESEIISTKGEVSAIDLDSVQAQIAAGYTDTHLNQTMPDMQSGSAQGIMMTSLEDSLDPTNGKIIQIVSLGGEDGQYLSLADGQQMQILNSEDLGLATESLENIDTSVDLTSSSTATVMNSSNTQMALVSLPGSTAEMSSDNNISIVAPDIKAEVSGSDQIAVSSGSDGGTSLFNAGMPQLVALPAAGEGGQPQLFALHRPGLNPESMQMTSLLGGESSVNQDLACHTITIMPSDLTQTGEMNYVLILSQPEGGQDRVTSVGQLCDLKQETNEISDTIVDENGVTKNVLRLIPKKYVSDINQLLVCDYCNYTSPKRYLLTRHMKSHSEERPFKCEACHRGFKTPASLLNHVNTHTGTRPHKCKTCDAAFTTSGELVRHIRYRHTFEKPHRCPECDYASVELSKLKRHMRSHTGERPYKCPSCPYASPDTYKLKRHMRIHTGEKPYECDICHARFTQSNSLKAHKLIHTGNKPVYQCSLCPTTCGRKTDLKIHFNKLHAVGSPLDCKKCGKAFSDRYSYKQHVRSHDMEKCYKCDQCEFMAATEKNLELHMSTHGKKYECEECHLSFILKHLLDKHKAIFHSNGSNKDSTVNEEKIKEENESGFATVLSAKYDLSDLPSESEESSSLLNCAPSTSDTLHKNLMQDIKEGKLGDVPQVVIVHPDGSQEEISSKLTGDKWSIEELFSTATNNGHMTKSEEVEKNMMESSKQKESNELTPSPSSSSSNDDPNIGDNTLLQTTVDQVNDSSAISEVRLPMSESCFNASGTSQLCEASTQAEIESDTDSSGETPDHNNMMVNAAVQLPTSVEDNDAAQPTVTKSTTSSIIMSSSSSSSSSLLLSSSSSTKMDPTDRPTVSSDQSSNPPISISYLKSLITQTPIVIKASSSSSSSLLSTSSTPSTKKLTSLLQFPKPLSSISNPSLQTVKHISGGQQYSLLKNFNFNSPSLSSSCITTSQPNAVGKDSVVKLFLNLGNTTENGDNINTNHSISEMTAPTISAQILPNSLNVSSSVTSNDTKKSQISLSSCNVVSSVSNDIIEPRVQSTDGSRTNYLHLENPVDMVNVSNSESNCNTQVTIHTTSSYDCDTDLDANASLTIPAIVTGTNSSQQLETSCQRDDKMTPDLSSEKFTFELDNKSSEFSVFSPSDQNDSHLSLMLNSGSCDADSSGSGGEGGSDQIITSVSEEMPPSTDEQNSSSPSSSMENITDRKMDNGFGSDVGNDKMCQDKTSTVVIDTTSKQVQSVFIPEANSAPLAAAPPPPPPVVVATSKKGKSGKRHADMDQSLVMPGKRIRKALVKVSL